ncbi:unnamed protein product [Prunus armeniaca]
MRVLQAKFTGASTSCSKAFGTRTVVTIDDDSDDGGTTESEASTLEQEDTDNIGDMHEGPDGNDNYDHDGDVPFDDYTEKQSGSDIRQEQDTRAWSSVNGILVSIMIVLGKQGPDCCVCCSQIKFKRKSRNGCSGGKPGDYLLQLLVSLLALLAPLVWLTLLE